MLESFLQAQKISVRRTLQRGFKKYLTYGESSNQLLMHKLRNLITEEEKFKLVSHILPRDFCKRKAHVCNCIVSQHARLTTKRDSEVPITKLEDNAKELNIYDLSP